MNIYIDFDDCLCENARYFSGLVKELFEKNVPYDRPWNRECELPGENYCRCYDWEMIGALVDVRKGVQG